MTRRIAYIFFGLHLVIAVFGISGGLFAAFNYGNGRAFFVNGNWTEAEVLAREHNCTNENRHQYSIDCPETLYLKDPRGYVLPPFAATALTAAVFAAAALLMPGLYCTTMVINSNIAMLLLNISFFGSFVQRPFSWNSNDVRARDNWDNSIVAVQSLHWTMMIFLALQIVMCGWHLRQKNVEWPGCKCLRAFTIGTLFSVAKLVAGSIVLPSIVQMQDEGVANFSTNLTHAAVAAMIVTQVFAIESFLSALWGTMHTQSTIVTGACTGLLSFVTGTVISAASLQDSQMSHIVHHDWCFAMSRICLGHAWLLWWCPKFMSSSPSLLNLLCGGNDKDRVNNSSDPNSENFSSDNDTSAITSAGNGEEVAEETDEGDTVQIIPSIKAVEINKGRRLGLNIIISVTGLLSLSFQGTFLDYEFNMLLADAVLVIIVTSVVASSVVTLLTIIISGHLPVTSDLQMLIQTMFEWVLLLTSAVASLAYNRGWISTVAAVLALFVLVVKVLDGIEPGPLRKAYHAVISGRTSSLFASHTFGSGPTPSPVEFHPSAPELHPVADAYITTERGISASSFPAVQVA